MINNDSIYEKLILEGFKIAEQECKGGYPDNNNCLWYHGSWMLLRYLGMVSNPYWHEGFYQSAIKKCELENSEILIAGTADFSMPLLCSENGCRNITIFDLCKTPLRICERVSKDFALNWKTKQQDVCKYNNEVFSAVVNDAFISRFENKEKALKGINNSLVVGGYYITSLKKKSQTPEYKIKQLRNDFVKRAINQFNDRRELFPNINIKLIAESYIRNMTSYPISGRKEVFDLLEQNGFAIINIEKNSVEGEIEPSEYYLIIAQKMV